MTKLDMYWMKNKEWIEYNGDKIVLKDNAPEDAKESYANYLRQKEEAEKRGSV